MKMIVPITVTTAMITDTDVPEDDTYSAWASGTSYTTGNVVYLASTTLRYKAVTASTGVDPSTDDGTYWSEYQTATRWRPFDDVLERYASKATSLYYEITPTRWCDSIAFATLGGGTIRIQVFNASDTEIHDETYSLVDKSGIRDFTSFITWVPSYTQKFVVTGLRIFAGYRVKMTFAVSGGDAQVGEIELGRLVTLGTSLSGVSIGGDDYSLIEANEWGERVPVERAYSDTADYTFLVENGDEERVKQLVAARRAKLTVFMTDEGDAARGSIVFGIPRIPEMVLTDESHSTATMEVVGYV